MKQIIHSESAPKAIGPYSQAIKAGNTVYLSGQIGLDPVTMHLAEGIVPQATQMFENLRHVAKASGGDLASIVKLTLYLTDMDHFAEVNQVMELFLNPPFPARACIGVRQLPKNALVEADAIMVLAE